MARSTPQLGAFAKGWGERGQMALDTHNQTGCKPLGDDRIRPTASSERVGIQGSQAAAHKHLSADAVGALCEP